MIDGLDGASTPTATATGTALNEPVASLDSTSQVTGALSDGSAKGIFYQEVASPFMESAIGGMYAPFYGAQYPGAGIGPQPLNRPGALSGIVSSFEQTIQSLVQVVQSLVSLVVSLLTAKLNAMKTQPPSGGATTPPETKTTPPTPKPEPAPAPAPTPEPPAKPKVDPNGTKTDIGWKGFLWKPSSDKDSHLVVLAPTKVSGNVTGIEIRDKDGNLIERGRASGIGNGGRAHYRFKKSGNAYPDGSTVRILIGGGKYTETKISDTAKRVQK